MRLVPLVGVLLAICTGCDDAPAGSSPSWQRSKDPVSAAGLPFAVGSTVHVDDVRIDTGVAIATFVVAGDGVSFLEDEDPDDGFRPTPDTHELRFASRTGNVIDTGIDVLGASLRSSPNGRHLAALDMESGDEDAYGTPQAALVVWDLESGEEIIRSTAATGDPDEDDFADLYPELEMNIPAMSDDSLVLDAAGTWSYDFATGEATELDVDDIPPRSTSLLVNPDSPWRIDHERPGQLLLGPGGAQVTPQADGTRLDLRGWSDQDTAYGLLRGARPEVVTCDVPSGSCDVLEGTAGQYVVLPNGLPSSGFDLTEPLQ